MAGTDKAMLDLVSGSQPIEWMLSGRRTSLPAEQAIRERLVVVREDDFWSDRVAGRHVVQKRHDIAYDETLGVDDYPATSDFVGNWHYTDYGWTDRFGDPVRLGVDGNGLAVPYNQIKFGSDAGETLEGLDPDPLVSGGGQDRLYGGRP